MSKTTNLTDFLVDLANAIREVKKDTSLINPQDFSNEIRSFAIESSLDADSGNTMSDEELLAIRAKQRLLSGAITDTVIDGETVYKITSQQNESNDTYLDLFLYTKEGDAAGYYYTFNSVDKYLNKEIMSTSGGSSVGGSSSSSRVKYYIFDSPIDPAQEMNGDISSVLFSLLNYSAGYKTSKLGIISPMVSGILEGDTGIIYGFVWMEILLNADNDNLHFTSAEQFMEQMMGITDLSPYSIREVTADEFYTL